MKIIYIIAVISFVFSSCTKEEEKGIEASATGFVKLVKEDGLEEMDRSNVNISVLGSSNNARSNDIGKFLFSNLRMGNTYDFEFTKENYGTITKRNLEFLSGAKPNYLGIITLYQMPTVNVVDYKCFYQDGWFYVEGSIVASKSLSVSFYINDSTNVSDTHHDYSTRSLYGDYSVKSFRESIVVDPKYPSGTVLYGVIYFANRYDEGIWDPDLKTFIYSSSKKGTEVFKLNIP